VRAAQLSLGKNGVVLERFGQIALPQGAVSDGEILDPQAVSEVIRELWAQAKFTSKKVIAGVANQRVVVRQVDLPWMPTAELKKSLPFQVGDLIPIPVEQAILDFHPLHEVTSDSGQRMLRLLLVAANRDMIGATVAAIEGAGLTPTMIDLNSFAVLRALGDVDPLGMGTSAEALIDVGSGVTNIIVHQGGVPRFVRVLLLGGSSITETVAERMGVPYGQAEVLKQQLGLTSAAATGAQQAAANVLEMAAGAWIDEIRGSLDYYRAQSGATPITRIVISGGASQLAGLGERLQAATRTPVQYGRPMERLTIGRTGLSDEQLKYVEPLVTVPVGLALGAAA
jgi:type IV pilus assembly protein PilM